MHQFSKATMALSQCINQALHSHGEIEPVLICSILFLCFEIGRGKFQNALAHLDFARRIMDGADLTGGRSPVQKKLTAFSSETLDDFDHMFDGIKDHAIISGMPAGLDQDGHQQLRPFSDTVPATFTSLAHAKESLNVLITASGDAQNELFQLADARITAEDRRMRHPGIIFTIAHALARAIVPSKVLQAQIRKMIGGFERWSSVMDTFTEAGRNAGNHQPFLLATTLRLQHLVAYSNLRQCTTAHETDWDSPESASSFASTLDLAEWFLTATPASMVHGPHSGHLQGSFAMEPAVLPALALVAFKCRDTSIRRRALRMLLTARRREGLGYSESMAWFISVYVDAEEQAARKSLLQRGLVPDENLVAEQVPEAARFLDMAIYAETADITRVVCARFRHEDKGQLVIREWRGSKEPLEFEEIATIETQYFR